MLVKEYKYCGYTIEIHKNEIYHDFEYVIKDENQEVKFASIHPYDEEDDVMKGAELKVHELEEKVIDTMKKIIKN